MLNLLRIGTGLAVVLAFVSANLWHELREERQLTAELQAQASASTNRDNGSVSAQRADARVDALAAAPKSSTGNPESAPPIPAIAPAPVSATGLRILNSDSDLMRDPEYRKARLTQLKMNLRRNYTDVAEELGLSEKETERLFDLLAEQQLGPGVSVQVGPDGQVDRQAVEEIRRLRDETQRQQQEALLALLGPGRQTRWQEYQQSLSARSRATSMTSMLASSGYPLTETQLRPLTTALIAEEKFVRQQQSTSRPPAAMTPQTMAQQQEEEVNRQEESNRRYLEAAQPYMSSQQLNLVRETLEQQIAISRANARAQRQRMEAR